MLNRCHHRSCFLFQRFPGLQSLESRTPSALLVVRIHLGLISRRIEKLPFMVFSVRGASSQSSDIASSLALGSFLEFWPTPAICCRARAPEPTHVSWELRRTLIPPPRESPRLLYQNLTSYAPPPCLDDPKTTLTPALVRKVNEAPEVASLHPRSLNCPKTPVASFPLHVDPAGIISSNPPRTSSEEPSSVAHSFRRPSSVLPRASEWYHAPKSLPPTRKPELDHPSEPFQQNLDDFAIRKPLSYLVLGG